MSLLKNLIDLNSYRNSTGNSAVMSCLRLPVLRCMLPMLARALTTFGEALSFLAKGVPCPPQLRFLLWVLMGLTSQDLVSDFYL